MNNTTLCLRNCQSNNFSVRAQKKQLRQHLQRWKQRLGRWYTNWLTRRQLVQLDGYQLQDIGVSLGEAMEEADKPFWTD
ncbi:MAG: DUF1127 domain-containing protein [Amphritea sp.]